MSSDYSFLPSDPNYQSPASPHPMVSRLAGEIRDWSFANFGNQRSKATAQVLGPIAPLLGVVEEYAEMIEPLAMSRGKITTENAEAVLDAFGDIVIYLMDFCNRSWKGHEVAIALAWPENKEVVGAVNGDVFANVIVNIGKLAHVTLKHHQAIRGMDDLVLYRQASFMHVKNTLASLHVAWRFLGLGAGSSQSLYDNARRVFTAVVAKRDWKKAPQTGDGSDEPGAERTEATDVS